MESIAQSKYNKSQVVRKLLEQRIATEKEHCIELYSIVYCILAVRTDDDVNCGVGGGGVADCGGDGGDGGGVADGGGDGSVDVDGVGMMMVMVVVGMGARVRMKMRIGTRMRMRMRKTGSR